MNTSKTFSLAFGSTVVLLSLAASPSLTAQVPASDPSTWHEIYVDDHCQVLDSGTGGFRADPDVCHLEGMGVHRSSHVAAKEVDGVRQRSLVNVAEQTYLLQDIHDYPVVFVVAQDVADGWQVDSDPQPREIRGSTAIFRVTAQSGQIVRLHTGEEHVTPIDDQQDQ